MSYCNHVKPRERDLYSPITQYFPSRITIAEDLQNTKWLTKDVGAGGAGFGTQADMRWEAHHIAGACRRYGLLSCCAPCVACASPPTPRSRRNAARLCPPCTPTIPVSEDRQVTCAKQPCRVLLPETTGDVYQAQSFSPASCSL
jgi:hypothetical protein